MAFSKRHYETIAQALVKAKAEIRAKEPTEHQRDLLDGVNYAADFLMDVFACDNILFSRDKFRVAIKDPITG